MTKLKNFIINNKQKVTLVLLGVLIFILAVVGITTAYMKYITPSDSVTPIDLNSCAKITLLDGGSSINLSNTAPMSNNMGMQTTPYEFTMKSTCDESVNFRVYLAVLNASNTLDASKVHYALINDSNYVLSEGILGDQSQPTDDFTENEITEYTASIGGIPTSIYIVLEDILFLQTESNYKLYLWVDENAINEVMGQTFTVAFMTKAINISTLNSDTNMIPN